MDNNLKFDVKKYRIVESKELIKEAIDPISAIIALVSFLLGGLLGASMSFTKAYGAENGKKMAEGVESIKKQVNDAINNSESANKLQDNEEFKKIIKDYEDSVLNASAISDETARKQKISISFINFSDEVRKFVKEKNLNIDVESLLNNLKITAEDVQTQQQADQEFKNLVLNNLAQPKAYIGITERVLKMYSKDEKTRRNNVLFFKNVIKTISRTKGLYGVFNTVNEIVSDPENVNSQLISDKLIANQQFRTLTKLTNRNGVLELFKPILDNLLTVSQRAKIKQTINDQLSLSHDSTSKVSSGRDEENVVEKGSIIEPFETIFRNIKAGNYVDVDSINKNISKLQNLILQIQNSLKNDYKNFGDNEIAFLRITQLLIFIKDGKEDIIKKGSEAIKKIFNIEINPVIDISEKNFEEIKDEASESLEVLIEILINLSKLEKNKKMSEVGFKMDTPPSSPSHRTTIEPDEPDLLGLSSTTSEGLTYGAALDDGTLVCEGCLFQYINEHKNLITEAKYQGRSVPLGKPMRGDVKKFKVFVKDPSTGNIKKVNFGDPNMKIKKNIPARRKSFRARHKCDTAKDRTSARYWSCRMWEHKQLDESINNRMKELAGLIED